MKLFLNLLLTAIVTILLNSCTNESNVKKDAWKQIDGKIYRVNDTIPYTGIVQDTVNGKVVKYKTKNGIQDGFYELYYHNGKIEFQGQTDNGKNTGIWKYYYPNGSIESEGEFINDSASGLWKWYYQDGTLREEGIILKGMRRGDWKVYTPEGELDTIVKFYENGTFNNE